MEGGLTLLRSSPHVIQCFLLWLNYKVVPPRHCVSRGVTREAFFFGKVEADLEPHATGLPVPRHLGNAIGHAMPGWDRPGMGRLMSGSFRHLVLGHLGFATGPSTPWKGHRVYDVLWNPRLAQWFSDLHLTTFPSLINDRDSPFFHSQMRVAHFFA